ncbi:MAG: hypothetical protein MRZ79_24205 [Bacteroidia bacterium]|nr:hypothetical protein [Bacteroidia bacterium]
MKHYEGGHAEMGANDPSQGIVILQPTSFTPSLKPTQNAVLTQKGMNFFPRVLPVTKGSTVYILNEDKEYHNVFSRTPGATFNIGRRPPGHLYPQKIKKSGLIRVFCDIHEQMNAIILSLETPYFVRVGKDNSYTLPNLPDGKYKMVVYHPEYPAHEEDVEISGSQIVTKDIHWK